MRCDLVGEKSMGNDGERGGPKVGEGGRGEVLCCIKLDHVAIFN